ncbi:MAG TPA: hypothetical protein VHN77_05295 [Phycisphaerales bacterium]|nr:hypothetical protein [Phycisphaerales bacterium]
MTKFQSISWAGVLIASAGLAWASPQPEGRQQAPDAQRGEPGGDLRERLDRALKDSEQANQKLRDAIARLDKGDDPESVKRELDMPLLRMWLMRDGQGPRVRDRLDGPGGPAGGRNDGMMPGDRGRGDPGAWGEPRRDERGMEGGKRPQPGQAPGPMGPGRAGGPGGGPGWGPEGAPEDRERLMAAVERELPEFAARMKDLRKKHPQLADRMFQRLAPRVRDALRVREHDPEMFTLRIAEIKSGLSVLEAIHASRQARLLDDTAPDAASKRADAEKQLREAVGAAFDARLKIDEHEAQRLSERVNDIRAEIEKKRTDREKAVDEIVGRAAKGEMPPP